MEQVIEDLAIQSRLLSIIFQEGGERIARIRHRCGGHEFTVTVGSIGVPALDLPLLPDPMMDERAVPVLLGLAEEDTERGLRVDGFGVDSLDGAGGGGYLTALMVSVSIPEGTETVTLSPFLWPTSARPTGESTEMRPADGSLSTAPTR